MLGPGGVYWQVEKLAQIEEGIQCKIVEPCLTVRLQHVVDAEPSHEQDVVEMS
jgi:hypothetical protein